MNDRSTILVNQFVYYISFMALLFMLPAHAGDVEASVDHRPHFKNERITAFALKVEKFLAERKVMVAIVSRLGRDRKELPPNVNYTHVGYWVYIPPQTLDNKSMYKYRAYNLYQIPEKKDKSRLVQNTPSDFFAKVFELDTSVIIPTHELQKKLYKVIHSEIYTKLHTPNYSAVANPFNDQYQNCTEHTLDVLVSALYGTGDLDRIKNYEKLTFTAQIIPMNRIKAMLGTMLIPEFTIRDQTGEIITTTFTTISNFMQKYDLAEEVYSIQEEAFP